MRVRQLCDAFARVLEQALRDGRLDCGRGPDLQLAVADRARGLSVGIRMATIEIEGLLAESRARDLYWRAQSAIEFKEEAFKTAESLLQGTDDPAKRIAAVAIIDLAWRQMASAVVRAIRERNKQLPFSREKNLGELGQYLFEQAAIDAGQLAAFNEANQIRNEALHAATLGVVPSRDRALRMLATAIEYRARSGLPA